MSVCGFEVASAAPLLCRQFTRLPKSIAEVAVHGQPRWKSAAQFAHDLRILSNRAKVTKQCAVALANPALKNVEAHCALHDGLPLPCVQC